MKKFSAHLTSINNHFQEQGRRRVVRTSHVKGRLTWGRLFYTFLLFFLLAGLSSEKAFGQITVGNSTAATGNNVTTLLINVPAGTTEGHVMIAHVSSRGNPTITAPGGWTLVGNDVIGTTMTTSVYYRVATAGEPANYTWNLSTAHRLAGSITTFQGVDTTNPIYDFDSQSNASNTIITTPEFEVTVDNAMLVGLFSTQNGNSTIEANEPLTNRPNAAASAGGGAQNGNAIGAGTQILATTGLTGTRSATASNAAVSIGFLVALTPTPPPPTQLVFTSSEADLASNTTRDLTVEVRDASNNLVSGDNDRTITFTKTAGDGTVTGLGSAQTVNGVATLTVTGETVGSITIEATTDGLTEDTTTFAIVPGTATQLEFGVQPSETQSGAAMSPAVTVRILDANENLVTNATNAVTLALTVPDGASLSGGGPINAESGVATFSNLSVDLVGNYTLTATADGLSDDVSNAFDIIPGDPNAGQSSFVVDPLSITTAETSTITITVRDAAGNIRTGGGDDLFITASLGTLSSSTPTDNADGTYTATLSSTSTGEATIRVYLGIDALGDEITPAETVTITAATFFSRTDGNWNVATSWSNAGFGGAAAGRAPAADDIVQIGDNDTITMTAGETNNQSVSVNVTGTLHTGDFVLGGSGDFTLASGATLGVGSADGIASSGASGSIQSSGTRTFDVGANYIYNGSTAQVLGSGLPNPLNGNLTINNASNVTAGASLTVNGTLTLSNGSLIIGSGFSLIANNQVYTSGDIQFELNIGTGAGYRMLSSPINTTYSNFLSGIRTDGFSGSTNPEKQPTVLWYDETHEGTDNQRWRAPGSSGETVLAGRGHFVYVFEDDEPTLTVNGQENSGNISEGDAFAWSVTHNTSGDNGWNLLGNPFGAAIPWADISRTNIENAIYIWDPSTNQFIPENGEVTGLTDGNIAPFQAFWVKANAADPVMQFTLSNKDTGGSFVGKELPTQTTEADPKPLISIQAYHSERLNSTAYFSFRENGKMGMDPYDAHRLLPPAEVQNFLEVYTRKEETNRLAISTLPRRFGRPLEVPLEINAFKNGVALAEDIWIKIDRFEDIPEAWSLELINDQTGERIPFAVGDSVRVGMSHLKGKKDSGRINATGKVVSSSKNAHVKFTLRINPNEDAAGLGNEFKLHQNYPNPFNPTTTFDFEIPIQTDVRLEIYDIIGRRVAVLVNESLQAGSHRIVWDASTLSSGIYIARLVTSDGAFIRKLTLIK